ncbi:condensin complex subunit 3 [Reticulomyxa filosa]|uniref:Condensin complex subunit 3 n=1 Tax=Reticulomyxa filosa TaxID=46433 RepID=X6NTQ4_RETFI|nr:condensin complex subunit 3 [Reticulomyxa filosa]|eukprot:ETO29149.1 condensin complex subunit 3 [Reticulomyxa filosa]
MHGLNERLDKSKAKQSAICQRIMCIACDLFEFTHKEWNHHLIQPFFNTEVPHAVLNDVESIRAQGVKAFAIFCCLDKRLAEKNIGLFSNALRNVDCPQEMLIALKAFFDFLLIFDLFPEKDDEAETNANVRTSEEKTETGNEPSPDDSCKALPIPTTQSIKEIIEILKEQLDSSDQDILNSAVEGFCKLLFMNRLKYYRTEILSRLFLLFHNPVTKDGETDQIRQTLSVFWSKFCDYNLFPSNKQLVLSCLMPCIRTVVYAPKDSPLQQVSLSNMTDHFLWLLGADPLTNVSAALQTSQTGNPLTLHEELTFDILFEIEANPHCESVKALSKLLMRLELDAKNPHNIKQFKMLTQNIQSKIATSKDKLTKKWLHKFDEKLQTLDKNPEFELNAEQKQSFEDVRQQRIQRIIKEHLELMDEAERLIFTQEFGIDDVSGLLPRHSTYTKKRAKRHANDSASIVPTTKTDDVAENIEPPGFYCLFKKKKKKKTTKKWNLCYTYSSSQEKTHPSGEGCCPFVVSGKKERGKCQRPRSREPQDNNVRKRRKISSPNDKENNGDKDNLEISFSQFGDGNDEETQDIEMAEAIIQN